ncbi:unnamed protein product [Bursaphelenchus okinawaensis]|uniref:Uncharacterized protein n=1 Tax=Bursaphelenchus okinawaensis TaxID=465554 RepID=A0A811KZV5_9BILA|nr:unnamed protein product [Bursaphelenchus okinawaensis]CAG9113661.1 unnamed protein product [Bursaphelenchus okinawaensis]
MFYHTNGIMVILKAKARAVIREVHREDVIVFSDCIHNKTSPLQYSKCLVSLINARDRIKMENNDIWASNFIDDVSEILQPLQQSLKTKIKPLRRVVNVGSANSTKAYGSGRSSYGREQSYGREAKSYGNRSYGREPKGYVDEGGSYKKESVSYSDENRSYSSQQRAYGTQPKTYGSIPKTYSKENREYGREPKLYSGIAKSYSNVVKTHGTVIQPIDDTKVKNEGDSTKSYPTVPKVLKREKVMERLKKQQDILRKTLKEQNLVFSRPLRGYNTNFYVRQSRRNKRGATPFKHIEKIQKIRDFMNKMDYCNNFFDKLKMENEEMLYSFGQEARFQIKTDNLVDEMTEGLQKIIQNVRFDKVSVLSPKIMSIFPSTSNGIELFSPDILNFQNTGILSLPQLFKFISSSDTETLLWLELLMEMTGASQKLDSFLKTYENDMIKMDNHIYPMVVELERRQEMLYEIVLDFTEDQKRQYKENGYTYISKQQSVNYFGNDHAAIYDVDDENKRERLIEDRIKKISRHLDNLEPALKLDQTESKLRAKRQERPGGPPELDIKIFQPYAFIAHAAGPSVLEGLILSPHAFISELMRPELATMDIISPRAFVTTILSPQALLARVLSPAAFRLELLSPTALLAWVVSPEAFIADVLSPRVLEPRIASPEFMTVQILSPGILSPMVGSDETLAFNVLSPNILSPRFQSKEAMVVEILSPHVLGGGHAFPPGHVQP